jgi:glycosidase
LDHRLLFFEKDEINWTKGAEFTTFYTRLNKLKKENELLWNADNGGNMLPISTNKAAEVLSFLRANADDRMLVFINVTNAGQELTFEDEGLSGVYIDLLTDQQYELKAGEAFTLPAWAYLVLK